MQLELKNLLNLATENHHTNFKEAEIMLKSANITWHKPVKFGDDLVTKSRVTRWGNSSFDIRTDGYVFKEHCFEASISYVCVDHIDYRPIAAPELLKSHLHSK